MVNRYQNVVIEYPLREVTVSENVGTSEYKTRWIGDTAISISPTGRHVPSYQRDMLIHTGATPVLSDYMPHDELEV